MLIPEDLLLIARAEQGLLYLEHSSHLTAEDKAALTHLASIEEPRASTIDIRSTESGPDPRGQSLDKKI